MLLTVTLNPTVDKAYYVDELTLGEVVRVKSYTKTAAGKGIQVAKVARLLGMEVEATGFLGGHNGNYVAAFMTAAGIETSFVEVEDETRTCINVNVPGSAKQTTLLEPGAPVSAEEQEKFLRTYAERLQECEMVAICGSVPSGIDESFYPKLIAMAKQAGKRVLLDTSGKLLSKGVEAHPDLIKPNRDELMDLIGRELKTTDEIIDAALELQARGVATVIVSLGKHGAIFATAQGVYHGTTPDIKIVNTIGCGDSLVAGYATGLLRKLPMEETIKLAMAVSTANALRHETGYFVQEDLDRLLKQVSAEKLR